MKILGIVGSKRKKGNTATLMKEALKAAADMKAFLERLYCYEVFEESDRSIWMGINEVIGGKFAATIAICEQHSEHDMGVTSEAMSLALASLGYRSVENVKVLELYEMNAAKLSERALVKSYNAGEKLAKSLLLKEKIKKQLIKSDF